MNLRATAILVLLFWCATELFAQVPTTADNRRFHLVSLIQVIANPNDFNGKPIRVVAFLARGGGLDRALGLFVSETDGRNYVIPNSIDLHLDKSMFSMIMDKDMMGRYVSLSGTYHAPSPRSDYNGYIDQVVEIKPFKTGDVVF